MDEVRTGVELPGVPPERALTAFTDAELVRAWWGGELTFEPHAGGAYTVRFEGLGRTLTGRVLDYDAAGGRLAFSWSWDGGGPEYRVEVRAVPVTGGSRLELIHGPYTGSDTDTEERASHRDGWAYFLPRLARALTG